MSEHTLWSIVETDINGETYPAQIVDSDGVTVLQANGLYDRTLESRADVLFLDAMDEDLRLIAAAPELLAACKAAIDCLDRCEAGLPDEPYDQLAAAIAAAEGE